MSGEGGPVDDPTVPEGLRALLGAIDDGRVEATGGQRAYLQGAAGSLVVISERRPPVFDLGDARGRGIVVGT